MLFDKVIAAEVFNIAALPAALLLKLMAWALVKVADKAVKFKVAELLALGVMEILPPFEGPSEPTLVTMIEPALIVVVPV